jgi:YD repeat-containing protein
VDEQSGQPGLYTTQHKTTYDYDAASNLKTRTHDGASSATHPGEPAQRTPRQAPATSRLSSPPIIGRRSPASSSFARADTSTLLVRVSPGERFGRLSFEVLMETASLGGWPGRPDAREVVVP